MKDYKKRTPYDKYKHYLVREFDMSLTKGQRNYAGFKANDYLKKQAYKDYGKNKDSNLLALAKMFSQSAKDYKKKFNF